MKWIQVQRRIPDTGDLLYHKIWVSEENKFFEFYQKSPAWKVLKREEREQSQKKEAK